MLGRNYPDTIGSVNDLGLAIFNQRRYDEALELFLEALEAQRRVQGHPSTLLVMSNVADTYHRLERYDDAERFHRAALEGVMCRN